MIVVAATKDMTNDIFASANISNPKIKTKILRIPKTPAFTTATACNKAETGVGATIAAGSQKWNGTKAALPIPKQKSTNKIANSILLKLVGRIPPCENSVDPAKL